MRSGRGHGELVVVPAGHQLVGELALLVERRVGLGDHVLALVDGREEHDLVGDAAPVDPAVRRFQEPVRVGARIQRERVDQADVRTFRRLDRAHAAVVGRVHVAHLEARPLAGQPARPQRRDAALVGDLGQRVGLVHELRQLRGAEELAHRRRHRLGVDQVVRHQVLGLGLGQALLDRPLDPHQPGAELVLRQLPHRAHAPVAEVVDVVDLAAAVAQVDQDADDRDDVLVGHRAGTGQFLAADPAIELHPPDRREVIALLGEEQAVEQRAHGVLGGRLARAHHAVDRNLGVQLVLGLVDAQGLGDVGPLVQIVGVDGLDRLDARGHQLLQDLVGDLVVGMRQDLAAFLVDDGVRQDLAEQEILDHRVLVQAGGFHFADVLDRDALVLGHDQLALLGDDVEARDLPAQPLGHQIELDAGLLAQVEGVELVEVLEDLLRRIAERLQQDRHRHLAAPVDAEVDEVLGIELEVEPGAAVGDDARREQQLARAVGLAAVVLEEHPGRAVQLGHDHALGAVDDERAGGGHERDLAHVDLLLLDFLHGRLGRLPVHDGQAAPSPAAARRR